MIIIKNKFGNVALNLESKQVAIRISGGFDSAVLLYILANEISKHQVDVTINPVTVIKSNNRHNSLDKFNPTSTVNNILSFVRLKFPKVKINPSKFKTCVDQNNETFLKTQNLLIQEVLADYNLDVLINYNGVTKNPPLIIGNEYIEEIDQNHNKILVHSNPEKKRDKTHPFGIKDTVSVCFREDNVIHLEPFRNFDKRLTMSLADDHGILNYMLQNTRSCEGRRNNTNNFQTTCVGDHKCWWCYEREWALENYDK